MIPWVKPTTVKGAQRPVPEKFDGWRERIVRFLRVLGPYAAIELFLPGGSLIALLLWLYQSQRRKILRRSTWGGRFLRGPLSTKIPPAGDYA